MYRVAADRRHIIILCYSRKSGHIDITNRSYDRIFSFNCSRILWQDLLFFGISEADVVNTAPATAIGYVVLYVRVLWRLQFYFQLFSCVNSILSTNDANSYFSACGLSLASSIWKHKSDKPKSNADGVDAPATQIFDWREYKLIFFSSKHAFIPFRRKSIED